MIPRAPLQHGRCVLAPPYAALPSAVAANRQQTFPTIDGGLGSQQQEVTRQQLLDAACAYTARYRNITLPPGDRPIIMVGHQPQWFHPGVWFKNFLMDRLAQQLHGLAIHVIIDNDLCRRPSLTTPVGGPRAAQTTLVPLDTDAPAIPFEERQLLDTSCFSSVTDRIEQALAEFPFQPLIRTLSKSAQGALCHSHNLGQTLAQARHQLEKQWGLRSLEVPLSHLCQGRAFLAFCSDLLQRYRFVHESYNQELHEFRRANRIRSQTHPVPPLHTREDWLEIPLWCWKNKDPQRRPLYVRSCQNHLQLSNLQGDVWDLPSAQHVDDQINRLEEWSQAGIRIRPRALTTTLFLRLFASDLFIHGIGGGSYDRLTDAWMRRLFNVTPPIYLTTTATIHLPGFEQLTAQRGLQTVHQQQRDLRFHPERFAAALPETMHNLPAFKQSHLQSIPPRGERKHWHDQLHAINTQMSEALLALRQDNKVNQSQFDAELRRERVLGSREFAFPLFPEAYLRDALFSMLPATESPC